MKDKEYLRDQVRIHTEYIANTKPTGHGERARRKFMKEHRALQYSRGSESRYELPFGQLQAVCEQESRWRNVPGQAGEIGVCQIKPSTVALVAGGNPYAKAQTVYAIGATGSTVSAIQAVLAREVDDELVVDGKYYRLTERAVRLYQSRNGLVVDGIVGRNTWGMLFPAAPFPGKTITAALWDPLENIEWSARIFVYIRDACGLSGLAATAAYNGGCGNPVVRYMRQVQERQQRIIREAMEYERYNMGTW